MTSSSGERGVWRLADDDEGQGAVAGLGGGRRGGSIPLAKQGR